jgi:hypothetical protein
MGKTTNIGVSAPSGRIGIPARRGQLKSLSGISKRHREVTNEEELAQFRSFLWRQAPEDLQLALNQFRRTDLSDKELAAEEPVIDDPRLSPELQALVAADPEASAYLQAALSLAASNPEADQRAQQLIAEAEEQVAAGQPLQIDVSKIEILLAQASADCYPEKLCRAQKEAEDLLIDFGVEPPDCQVLLIPPVISALASNCDQTPLDSAKLRSGRFYPQESVILITDDRQVINRDLLLHELIHAKQNQSGRWQMEASPQAMLIYEALTERLAAEIDSSYTLWPEDRSLINRIEALPLSAEELTALSWQDPDSLFSQLARSAFPGRSDSKQALLAALDLE